MQGTALLQWSAPHLQATLKPIHLPQVRIYDLHHLGTDMLPVIQVCPPAQRHSLTPQNFSPIRTAVRPLPMSITGLSPNLLVGIVSAP